MRNKKQNKTGDYITYAAYRIFEFALRLMPLKIVCIFGSCIGQLGYYLMRQRRSMVIHNLRIALGEDTGNYEIHALARRTFNNSGANFLASIHANTWKPEELKNYIEISGTEHLEAAQPEGTGVILLLAHMGNWETLTQMHLLAPSLIPLAGLYRPLDNPLLDKLIKRRRQATGAQLFSRYDGFFKPLSHLKSGGSLGVIADQHAGKHGMAVPFFDKLTSMTNLPALLNRRTGAPIIPVSMCSVSPGRWRIVIHPAVDIAEEKKSDTLHVTSLCSRAYETIMRENPSDVLWMHRYWRVGKKSPLHIDGIQKKKQMSTIEPPSKLFKILIFTGDSDANDQEAVNMLERLSSYRPDIELTLAGQHVVFPEAAHQIAHESGEPPHMIASAITRHDLEQTTPFDCALDFTRDASGANILEKAGSFPVFAMQGKHRSVITKSLFNNLTDPTLADFLASIGLPSIESPT